MQQAKHAQQAGIRRRHAVDFNGVHWQLLQLPDHELARNRKLWNKQSATSAHLVVVHRHAVGHQVADGHDRSVPLIRQLQCRNGYKRRQRQCGAAAKRWRTMAAPHISQAMHAKQAPKPRPSAPSSHALFHDSFMLQLSHPLLQLLRLLDAQLHLLAALLQSARILLRLHASGVKTNRARTGLVEGQHAVQLRPASPARRQLRMQNRPGVESS